MELIVDLHVHSHYSRATSKDMDLSGLYKWSKIKGISVVGTGDITHPAWFREVSSRLGQVEGGLYQLQRQYRQPIDDVLPVSCTHNPLYFIPTVEISTIYSKKGKVRKIHQVVVLPDLPTAALMNEYLSKIGNLSADGRPILGLDSKELLNIISNLSDQAFIIPAHIWTPWFGMFGSKSGFDSLVEAYDERADQITAIETGLSSDPAMNWRVSELHRTTITSHSDAHSPQKLGREATVVECEGTYEAITQAIRTNDQRLKGTIEFYPQEGKYHYDGHRACGISLNPEQTKELQGMCPVCGRELTIGVEHRVLDLEDFKGPPSKKQVEYIIPLTELLASILNLKSTSSRKVQELYHTLIAYYGDEFSLLRHAQPEQLRHKGFSDIATAIEHMRAGMVEITPGYDGVYGTIKIPHTSERSSLHQLTLGL